MAYTILVCENNDLYGSHKETIMQRSKLVDVLYFIVPQYYKEQDMADYTVQLEYLLPCSKKYCTEILTMSDEKYDDCHLKYTLPFDTNLTSESGSVQIQLTFVKTELDENGKGIQRVRKTSTTTIEIVPIAAWADIIPDSALSAIDERLIKLDASMRAMNDYLDVIDSNKVDNLVYNEFDETLQLSANGVGIGGKVSVREMLDDGIPVVDLDSSDNTEDSSDSNNGSNSNHHGDCNCGCEDNVVEFGYSDNETITDDNNVVEF